MTVSGVRFGTGSPVLVASERAIGPDGVPAVSVWVGATVSTACVQARNDFQASFGRPSAWSATQNTFCPGGPHAALPGSSGSADSPESRTAAASRSRIAPVWAPKSALESPVVFLGAQAKPQWSRACPAAALK